MTPEEKQQHAEMYKWFQDRKRQFVINPLDAASQQVLKIPRDVGLGQTALTQIYNVSGGAGGTITGPKAYSDTFLLLVGGETYEIPFLTKTP